jgi:hypothetical protein
VVVEQHVDDLYRKISENWPPEVREAYDKELEKWLNELTRQLAASAQGRLIRGMQLLKSNEQRQQKRTEQIESALTKQLLGRSVSLSVLDAHTFGLSGN